APDAAARKQIAADIVAWCLSRLAYYKAPGSVAFVSAVPLTSTQKIQRGALKELVAATINSQTCGDTRPLKKRPAQKAGRYHERAQRPPPHPHQPRHRPRHCGSAARRRPSRRVARPAQAGLVARE